MSDKTEDQPKRTSPTTAKSATKPAGSKVDADGNVTYVFEDETEYERAIRINGEPKKGGTE